MTTTEAPEQQRIDRWLWCARFFKTRTLASKFVTANSVRLNRNGDTARIEKASLAIRAGDTLIFSRNDRLRIIDVLACATRRGPASEAATLYDDRSPPPPPREEKQTSPFMREKGLGRPTKKDRRSLDNVRQNVSGSPRDV